METSKVRQIILDKIVGQIIPKHDEKGHHYLLPSGKLVDSVTTKIGIISKPHLLPWAVKMGFEWLEQDDRFHRITPETRDEFLKGAILAHTDVRDDAGNVGNQGHDVIEEYMIEWIKTGKPVEDIRSIVPYGSHYRVVAIARAAEAIFKKYQCLPIATEILVGSDKWNCAGALDALVMLDGELELWDWKSSNAVDQSYSIQVSAYKKFFEEMTGLTIARCRVVKLDKFSDKFKVYNIPNLDKAFDAFQAISAVYDWTKNGEPKLLEDKITIKL